MGYDIELLFACDTPTSDDLLYRIRKAVDHQSVGPPTIFASSFDPLVELCGEQLNSDCDTNRVSTTVAAIV